MVRRTADMATVWTCENSRPVAPASSAWTIASRSIVTLSMPSDHNRPVAALTITRMPAAIARLKPRSIARSVFHRSWTTRDITSCANPGDGGAMSRIASSCSIDRARASRGAQTAHDATWAASSADNASESSAIASINGSRSSQRTSAVLRFEQVPQAPLRAMQVCFHRAHRQVQRLGEVLVSHALQVVPVDQDLVLERQLFDRLLQPILDDQVAKRAIVRGGLDARAIVFIAIVERRGRQLGPLLRQHVDHDAIHPRRQLRLAAEERQALVHLEEHVLRELLGPGTVGNAPRDQRKDQALVLIDQLPKGGFIALPAPLDQLVRPTTRSPRGGGPGVLGGPHSPSGRLEQGDTDFVSGETIGSGG